jgi:2-(1,2-epoxy-1,2-dihydrophenyl)acetyl-CoA isomerase
MSEHPTAIELEGLVRGGVGRKQARVVVRHMLRGCERCVGQIAPYASMLINGPTAGGGYALALAGDIRLGLPGAIFRVGYGRAGLTMDGGLSWRLPRLVGYTHAQRLVFEDPDVDADEAQALGLIHRVVPPSEVDKTIAELIERTKLQSRGSILRNRQLLLESQGRALEPTFEAEGVLMKTCAGMPDGREGIVSFVEKRPPKFTS